MTAILKITDGTPEGTVNLLADKGLRLMSWKPAAARYKGGGTFQDSPMAHGRQLVLKAFDNARETIELVAAEGSQDDLIEKALQKLEDLLEQASDYWLSPARPVWLWAKAANETNGRYAMIHKGKMPDYDDPYRPPFFHNAVPCGMKDLVLALERGHWLADEPGTGTCVQTSGEQDSLTQFTVKQSEDDCDVRAGTITLAATTARMGHDGSNRYDAGLRFRDVTVPQGKTIRAAYIRFDSSAALAGATCKVRIRGEDNSTPAAFSTAADFYGRAVTTAQVDWANIPGWSGATKYLSPDLATIVQEIVDRADWVSGSDLALLIEDDGSDVGAYRRWHTWDDANTGNEPELFIEYEDGQIGRSATCLDEVYFANKRNTAQLTDVFYFDADVGYGLNLVNADTPFEFLPVTPAVDDYVLFGRDANFGDGPFPSLVFDIGTPQAQLTIEWRYYNGGLVALTPIQDNTASAQAFDTAGVNSVHWEQPSDWLPLKLNGVTAYWVYAYVTAVGGAPTPPTQQNRSIYTVLWPYVEVAADEIGGSIPCLLQAKLRNQSSYRGSGDWSPNRVIVGLRDVARGADFSAYVNFASEQNPAGIFLDVSPANTTEDTDTTTPSGKRATWNPAGVVSTPTAIAWLDFDSTILPDYYGKHHVFLRVRQVGGSGGDVELQLGYYIVNTRTSLSAIREYTELVPIESTSDWQILDFGRLTVPLVDIETADETAQFTIAVLGINSNASPPDVYLYDVILIPVDEWAGDFEDASEGHFAAGRILNGFYLDVDSVGRPKDYIRAFARTHTDRIYNVYQPKSNGGAILRPKKRQRLWFLGMERIGSGKPASPNHYGHSAQLVKNQRYLGMRGSK